MSETERRRVLNVGGNSKAIPLPDHFAGWDHVLLDIDPAGAPDIVCDARDMTRLDPDQFDAIYCSHNLEHYHRHELPRVLGGFLHVLKPEGFAHIRVPDLGQLFRLVVDKKLDIESVLYEVPGGPVHVYDVIYGWQQQVARSGNEFYCHKNGFTAKSLVKTLQSHGFDWVYVTLDSLNIIAFAFAAKPPDHVAAGLNLPTGEAARPRQL